MSKNKELEALIRKTQRKVDKDINNNNEYLVQKQKERGCYKCSLLWCRKCSDCHDPILKSQHNF